MNLWRAAGAHAKPRRGAADPWRSRTEKRVSRDARRDPGLAIGTTRAGTPAASTGSVKVIAFVALAACAAHPVPVRSVAEACDGLGWGPLVEDHAPAPALELRVVPVETAPRVAEVTVSAPAAPLLVESVAPLLATAAGMPLEREVLRADLRRIWALGVVADARVEVATTGDGAHVTFVVAPHAAIDRVVAPGAPELARLRALAGGAYEPRRIRRLADALQDRYVDDGYLDARISVFRARRPGVTLCVVADRGPHVTISAIRFPGRTAIADTELLAALRGVRIGGTVSEEQLQTAVMEVELVYLNRGYARVRTNEALVVRHGALAEIEISVIEGAKYTIGAVRTTGIAGAVELAPGELYSRDRIATARDELQAKLDEHQSQVVVEDRKSVV